MKNVKEKFNKKLLVEGNDDLHVVKSLCGQFDILENFDVRDCEGYNSVLDQASVIFKTTGVITAGFILDADTDFNARWQSISNILSNQGFQIPKALPSEGLIVENDGNKAGVWLMPNNNLNGMLEDFVSFSVPEQNQLMPAISHLLSDFERNRLVKYLPKDRSKAQIHSWLAMQEVPGRPLGLAITSGYLSKDEATCITFIKWLEKLFEETYM